MDNGHKLKLHTWIKLCIAALMILCLLPMPYGFYNLVRFISMIGFIILAVRAFNSNRNILAIVYGSLALMFQPFMKLVLGRDIWNVVDIVVAILLIGIVVKDKEIRFS